MLNDKHINYSQEILRAQFQSVGIVGLQSTLTFGNHSSMVCGDKCLQIIHCRQNHWIVASTIKSYPEVFIYDSLYESVDEPTMNKIKEVFGAHTSVKIATGISKQEGFADCGLFAIATCVSLVCGKQPSKYLQNFMRTHLINCFENGMFVEFPSV